MYSPTKIKRFAYVLLLACLAQANLAHSALLSLQPSTTFADTGDSFSLDLVVSGLNSSGPDSLGAFDISIDFDASALSFTSYDLGNFLGDVGAAEAIDASGGLLGSSVNLAEVSLLSTGVLDALQPGAFTLATLDFSVLNLEGGASTQLSFAPGPVLGDGFGFGLPATTSAPATIQSSSSGVPVPGTLLLLATALFGLRTLSRRRPR